MEIENNFPEKIPFKLPEQPNEKTLNLTQEEKSLISSNKAYIEKNLFPQIKLI